MNAINIPEIILSIGISIIAYFLKLIHADLRAVINDINKQRTEIAVAKNRFDDLEHRIEKLEEKNTHDH